MCTSYKKSLFVFQSQNERHPFKATCKPFSVNFLKSVTDDASNAIHLYMLTYFSTESKRFLQRLTKQTMSYRHVCHQAHSNQA